MPTHDLLEGQPPRAFAPRRAVRSFFIYVGFTIYGAFTNSSMPDLTISHAGLYSAYFSISLIRAGRMVNSISSFFVFFDSRSAGSEVDTLNARSLVTIIERPVDGRSVAF